MTQPQAAMIATRPTKAMAGLRALFCASVSLSGSSWRVSRVSTGRHIGFSVTEAEMRTPAR